MDECFSPAETSPQPHRQGWKPWLIMVGLLLFLGCAKEGQIRNLLTMPQIPSYAPDEAKPTPSTCDIQIDNLKDDVRFYRELYYEEVKSQPTCYCPDDEDED
jgi:hypothetical protein